MTTLDIVLLGVGVPFFIYAFTPQKFRVWKSWTTNPKESETDRDSQESKKKESWEIRGARKKRFKLYEAACLIVNTEPAWPLPNKLSMDELDVLVDAVRVHDPAVKHVELRIVIPDYAIRPLDTSFPMRQHTYIETLRIKDEQQVSRYHAGTPIEELDREAIRNVEVDRKVLREYLESKSRPVPGFLHEIHDKSDSGQ